MHFTAQYLARPSAEKAHAILEGRPAYDFSWLWEELRLERKRQP